MLFDAVLCYAVAGSRNGDGLEPPGAGLTVGLGLGASGGDTRAHIYIYADCKSQIAGVLIC